MSRAVVVALLAASGAVQAADWVSLGFTEDRTQEVFVDVSNIRVGGNIRTAWIRHVYAPSTNTTQSKWAKENVGLMEIDCNQALYRPQFGTTYFSDGSTESTSAADHPQAWNPVTPDSQQEAELKLVCSSKSKLPLAAQPIPRTNGAAPSPAASPFILSCDIEMSGTPAAGIAASRRTIQIEVDEGNRTATILGHVSNPANISESQIVFRTPPIGAEYFTLVIDRSSGNVTMTFSPGSLAPDSGHCTKVDPAHRAF